MIRISCADELVIRRIHHIPYSFDLLGNIIHKLLRRNAHLFRFQLYLLAMLVCSRLEIDIIALAPLIACDGIRQHNLISIPDMRLA